MIQILQLTNGLINFAQLYLNNLVLKAMDPRVKDIIDVALEATNDNFLSN